MKIFYSTFLFGAALLDAALGNASQIYRQRPLQPASLGQQPRLMPSQSGVFFDAGSSIPPLSPSFLSSNSCHYRTNSSAEQAGRSTLRRNARNSEHITRFLPVLDPLQEVMAAMQPSLLSNDIHGTLSILQSYANAKQYDVLLSLARQQELLTRILTIAQEDRTQTSTGLECFELFDQAAEALSEVAPLGVRVGYQCLKYVLKGLSSIIEKSSDRIQDVKAGKWTDKSGNNVAHLAAKNYSPKLTAWCLVNCVPEVFDQKNKQGRTPYELAEVKRNILVKEYEAAIQKKEDQAEAKAKRLEARAERRETKRKKKSARKAVEKEVASSEKQNVATKECVEVKVAAKYKRKIRHIEDVIALLSEVRSFSTTETINVQNTPLTPFPSLQSQIQAQVQISPQPQLFPFPTLERSLSADKFAVLEKQGTVCAEKELDELRTQLEKMLNLMLEKVEQNAEQVNYRAWREITLGFLTDLTEGQKLLLEIITEQAFSSSNDQEV